MQATYLHELYEEFIFSVNSSTFIRLTKEEIEEDLFYLFKKARGRFHKCKQSLELLEDTDGDKYFGYMDENNNEIKVVLTDFEKTIITHLMLAEYLKPFVMTEEFLRPSMSDKGFKIHSQGNHLRELSLLYRLIQKECSKRITEYTYLDLEGDKQ